jgi:hypothetical protein
VRRADSGSNVTNSVVVDPYEVSVVAAKNLSHEDDAIIPKLNDTMGARLGIQKRDITTSASVSA